MTLALSSTAPPSSSSSVSARCVRAVEVTGTTRRCVLLSLALMTTSPSQCSRSTIHCCAASETGQRGTRPTLLWTIYVYSTSVIQPSACDRAKRSAAHQPRTAPLPVPGQLPKAPLRRAPDPGGHASCRPASATSRAETAAVALRRSLLYYPPYQWRAPYV